MAATIVQGPADTDLTVSDRCDACGAQGFVLVSLMAGPLIFCGHHYHIWKEKIDATAFKVVDSRDRINQKPSSG